MRKEIKENMTVEEMRRKKQELGYSYEQIANLAGLPLGTVQKVLGGITKSPRYATLQALQMVFEKDYLLNNVSESSDRVEEGLAEYRVDRNTQTSSAGRIRLSVEEDTDTSEKQGNYTLDDYFALPKDSRAELIDGVFFDMAAPTHVHQAIGYKICRYFDEYIQENHCSCRPFVAPLDVQLDCDEKTMVQPDVLIVCDLDKLRYGRVYGSPDLVVEILSRSTLIKDSHLKRIKYAQAGVREYWLVYPEQKTVVAYDLEKGDHLRIYGFTDCVPVQIFNGACRVDFAEIYEYVSFLYDRL
ncbi:MAG: Uma2 family endonuclease [Lachnospiraceae bacterium]|nr:Uma2 family endonuclease [Lachnospiraceae bacterium]